jgi:hypothetical protein
MLLPDCASWNMLEVRSPTLRWLAGKALLAFGVVAAVEARRPTYSAFILLTVPLAPREM